MKNTTDLATVMVVGATAMILLMVEVAAFVVIGVAAWRTAPFGQGWLSTLLIVGPLIAAWSQFASPKAPRRTMVTEAVVKTAVFGATIALLWVGGVRDVAVTFAFATIVGSWLASRPIYRELMHRTTTDGHGA